MGELLSTPPFTLSRADYVEFNNFHVLGRFIKPLPAVVRWGGYVIGLCLIILFTWHTIETGDLSFGKIAPIIIVIGVWGAFLTVMYRARYNLVKSDPLFKYDTIISLDTDGIYWRNFVADGALTWPAVPRVAETENVIILYTGGTSALIVPKRIFHSEQEAAAFVDAARQFKVNYGDRISIT